MVADAARGRGQGRLRPRREAIMRFEPLLVVAEPGLRRDAAAYCPGAEILEHPLEDAYLRDSGPLFVRRADGTLAAVDFLFNGWGGGEDARHGRRGDREPRSASSASRSRSCSRAARSPSTAQGTLIAVEPTVLHENRNPGATRALFEAAFASSSASTRTIWLEHGLIEDRTGGHVDNVAAFIGPNRVACQVAHARRPEPRAARAQPRRRCDAGRLRDRRASDRLPPVGRPPDRAAVRELLLRQRRPDRAARARADRRRGDRTLRAGTARTARSSASPPPTSGAAAADRTASRSSNRQTFDRLSRLKSRGGSGRTIRGRYP